jgi:hypothetical protein
MKESQKDLPIWKARKTFETVNGLERSKTAKNTKKE